MIVHVHVHTYSTQWTVLCAGYSGGTECRAGGGGGIAGHTNPPAHL